MPFPQAGPHDNFRVCFWCLVGLATIRNRRCTQWFDVNKFFRTGVCVYAHSLSDDRMGLRRLCHATHGVAPAPRYPNNWLYFGPASDPALADRRRAVQHAGASFKVAAGGPEIANKSRYGEGQFAGDEIMSRRASRDYDKSRRTNRAASIRRSSRRSRRCSACLYRASRRRCDQCSASRSAMSGFADTCHVDGLRATSRTTIRLVLRPLNWSSSCRGSGTRFSGRLSKPQADFRR